ncbi:MAG: hypothetical protein IJU69_04890 [Bacteroidales bacterium]|nr:hypothetical protein [Bacteroidales bacterium]
MKFYRCIIIVVFLFTAAVARAGDFRVSGSMELASGYIWRGDRVCGVQISPSLTLSYKGFALQSFGYLALDGSYKEIDWDLSYSWKDFSVHIADYFYRGTGYVMPENYFNFRKEDTTHIVEAIFCYEPEKLPFCARWFTFVYGDWIPDAEGKRGKPSFSSYLELEGYYNFQSAGKLSLFMGSSIFKGAYTAYQKPFAVIHLELRYAYSLNLGKVSMPLSAGFILNPYSKAAYLNASVGISF